MKAYDYFERRISKLVDYTVELESRIIAIERKLAIDTKNEAKKKGF